MSLDPIKGLGASTTLSELGIKGLGASTTLLELGIKTQFSSYAASKKAYFKYPLKLQRQNDLISLNTIFFVLS